MISSQDTGQGRVYSLNSPYTSKQHTLNGWQTKKKRKVGTHTSQELCVIPPIAIFPPIILGQSHRITTFQMLVFLV